MNSTWRGGTILIVVEWDSDFDKMIRPQDRFAPVLLELENAAKESASQSESPVYAVLTNMFIFFDMTAAIHAL